MAGEVSPQTSGSGRRKGRGKLSTIERLPEAADEAIAWANQELRDGKLPQTIILVGFNDRLVAKGLKPISKGAFSRYSVRMAIEGRKLAASRQLADAILSRLPAGERSDSTIAATELLKYRILDMVMSQEEPDPKAIDKATLALNRLSTIALREAHGQRLERQDQVAEEARQKADQQAAAAGDAEPETAAAIDPDAVLKRIREDVYGIFEK